MKFVQVADEVASVEISFNDIGEIGRELSNSKEDSRAFVLGLIFRGAHERLTQVEGSEPMPEDGTILA